jgi:uncharacterized membrane protein
MYALAFPFAMVWLLAPIIGFIVVLRLRSDLNRFSERLDHLEEGLSQLRSTAAPVAPIAPVAHTAPAAATLTPIAPTSAATPAIVQPPAAMPTASPGPTESDRLEQLIGGIWLQNVGSVLLLLGTFFLILWGYTQGKIGAEVLVAAGVALGVVLAWRGDRIAQTLRPWGHALLGVGLGVVYITIYLGHFRMGVLPEWVTFVLLALLSFLTVDIGLRREQAVIASLGVVGAFVPLLMAPVPNSGFHLSSRDLIGYFAVVNAIVFALTAARGWSGLLLMALGLTTITWIIHTAGTTWGFPIQLGLSALYVAFGMAPVIRLVQTPIRVRGVDLAVVASAPMLLLVGSVSYFAATKGVTTGGLLAALGLVNLIVAVWVDSRRSERDLWRPLTAAATVFIAAALERLLANEYVSLAWCVEGAVLVWLGLAPRSGWIRGLGYGLSLLAALRILAVSATYDPVAGGGFGIINGTALRDLLCIVALLVVSDRIGRRRESLSDYEHSVPGIWVAAINALLMWWSYWEAPHIARWVAGPHLDSTHVLAFVWTLHTAALALLAAVRRAPILRHVGYAVGMAGILFFLMALIIEGRYWREGDIPVLYPAGILTLLCVLGFVGMASFLWSRRGSLASGERRAPEAAVIVANIAMLLWTAREAGHVAYAIAPGAALTPSARQSTAMLAAGITSAAWILQAGALLAIGWVRGSPFHRWTALALIGLTLSKFVLFDLQRIDVFWRFVIALGVGAVLLLFSFVYQRRNRSARAVAP